MDQDDLNFLETYEEKFANLMRELDMLETEISSMEKKAIDSGMLHPSEIYSRYRSWKLTVDKNNKQSVEPVIKVPVDLPNTGNSSTTLAMSHPIFQLPSAPAPETDIDKWLEGVSVSSGD